MSDFETKHFNLKELIGGSGEGPNWEANVEMMYHAFYDFMCKNKPEEPKIDFKGFRTSLLG